MRNFLMLRGHVIGPHFFFSVYQPLTISYLSNDVIQSHQDVTYTTWRDGHSEKSLEKDELLKDKFKGE